MPKNNIQQENFMWPIKPILVGWVIGLILALSIRYLGNSLIVEPCKGRAFFAFLMPLVLGPGGLAFTAFFWKKRTLAMFGIGLMISSFIPSLLLSTYDIGRLRHLGCAGGYLIISKENGKQISEISIHPEEKIILEGKISGYQITSHSGEFLLEGISLDDSLNIYLPKNKVQINEKFPIEISAKKDAAMNRFDWGIKGTYLPNGKESFSQKIEVQGKISVTILLNPK